MSRRLRAVAGGVLAGAVAGGLWWAVEIVLNLAAGAYLPGRVVGGLVAVDVGAGAVAGLAVGAVLALRGAESLTNAWPSVALALAVAYGLLRVYEPPGLRGEALYLVLAAAAAVGARRYLVKGAGTLAALQVGLLTTVALAGGTFLIEDGLRMSLPGWRLPVVVALLVLAGAGADRLLALLIARPGRRLVASAVGLLAAAVLFGHPVDVAPLERPLGHAVEEAGRPPVVLISFDTTRADRLSTYGYRRATSPNLSALAREAVLYTACHTTSSWTLPAHASLFTGLYPRSHGAHLVGHWLPGRERDGRRRVAEPLAPARVTLAEVLRDHGYATGAVVANFSYLYRGFGLAQGFDFYDDSPGLLLRFRPPVVRLLRHRNPGLWRKPYRSARAVNAAALAWLDRVRARPFFLFVNYMEPHRPWLAEPPYDRWSRGLDGQAAPLSAPDLYTSALRSFSPRERAVIDANYDGEVAAMDAALGELLAGLRARGLYDRALIIVVADHGELLGEHGEVGHIGRMLYEPLLHVPLIVRYPGGARAGEVSTRPVQLVDILPTVLGFLGIPVPRGVQGQPLDRVTHAVVAEESVNPTLVARYGGAYDRAVQAIYDGPYKLIATSQGQRMLFDLARDPEEAHDLAAVQKERATKLAARLDAYLGTMVAAVPAARGRDGGLGQAATERLRALGYVN